ncbi:hypothetical protein AB0M46_23485 [Dactylosporangium sp. NPDC051485]|uniref:hypothetical protein n=1 Tax=Dactylosporangium sp. NPDC051485 TaxID=3154846 RepID=UPI00341AA5E8
MTQPPSPCRVIDPAGCGRSRPAGHRSTPAGETADTSGGPRSPRRIPALAAAVLLAAAAMAIGVPGTTPAPATVTAGADPDLLALSPQGQLLLLAQRVQPTAADALTGDDSCVRIQRSVEADDSTIVFESVRRISPSGAGIVTQRRATVPSGAGAAEVGRLLDQAAATVTTYGSGELLSPVGDPVPVDAQTLAVRVAARTGAGRGAAAVVAVLTDLATVRYLDVAQRVAVLRVLATLPSLTGGGLHPDPAGRTGITVQVDDGTSTIRFSVDPSSGRLLTAEVVPPGGGHRHVTQLLGSTRCTCPPPAAPPGSGAVFWPPVLRTAPLLGDPCSTTPGTPTIQPVDRAAAERR